MTVFQVFSDIHADHFHGDIHKLAEFVQSLNPKQEDRIALVAGDQETSRGNTGIYELLADQFSQVICVLGNHDVWGGPVNGAVDKTKERITPLSNIRILDNEIAMVGGRRILGCTGWFPGPIEFDDRSFSDFMFCNGLAARVDKLNTASREFLAQTQPDDIVMTHHIPHESLVQPRWRGCTTNRFFVSGFELRPCALQIWGHTHDSTATDNLACNPYGYHAGARNPEFRKELLYSL